MKKFKGFLVYLLCFTALLCLFACDGGKGQNGGQNSGQNSGQNTFLITTQVKDGYTQASSNGQTVYTFTKGGEYTLSGSLDGCLVFDAGLIESVTLYLDNCTINSKTGAIYWNSEVGKIEIKAISGTENQIVAGLDGALDVNSAIDSNNNVELGGSGKLTVISHSKHAVKGSNVEIKGSVTLTIKAVKDGLHAKQVSVVGGDTVISDCIDGIQADLNSKGFKGTFSMTGGTLTIKNCGTAIQAQASVTVTAGVLKVNNCAKFLKTATYDIAPSTTTVDGVSFN